jgi:hypothetical protein
LPGEQTTESLGLKVPGERKTTGEVDLHQSMTDIEEAQARHHDSLNKPNEAGKPLENEERQSPEL